MVSFCLCTVGGLALHLGRLWLFNKALTNSYNGEVGRKIKGEGIVVKTMEWGDRLPEFHFCLSFY